MKSYIRELANICNTYRFEEKVLIVESFPKGEGIVQSLIESNFQAINLKIKTVKSLAVELLEEKSIQPMKYLDTAVGVHFIYQILCRLKEDLELDYFRDMEVTPSFSQSIYQLVMQLRLAGYMGDDLDKSAFVSRKKADDIEKIMRQYEDTLARYQMMDDAMIYRQSIKVVDRNTDIVFIVQPNLNLSKLEYQLLENLLPNSFQTLPLPKIYGIQVPECHHLSTVSWDKPTKLSYLYQLDKVQEKPKIDFYRCHTVEGELKNILSSIKSNEIPLDQVSIFYTDKEPYITTAYQLAEKYKLPMTFGKGISILASRPGKLILALISWINQHYSVPSFVSMLNEGLIELPNDAPSNLSIIKHLRSASIGWGRDRYEMQLEFAIKEVKDKLGNKDSEHRYDKKKLEELTWLKDWFSKLFRKFPKITDEINYRDLLEGIRYVIIQMAKTSSAIDEASKTEILNKIDMIIPFTDETLSTYNGFEKVKNLLLTIRVNQSGAKPGHIHITSYKYGIYNSRTNVFIIGLDNHRYPGNANEDPLLLDEERKNLSSHLPLLKDKGMENHYTMLQLLSLVEGRLSVSYCSFDVIGKRVVSPSHLYLQCFRLTTGNYDADIKDFYKFVFLDEIMDEKDFWINEISKEIPMKLQDRLLEEFQNLEFGLEGEQARKVSEFSKFDGLVHVQKNEMNRHLEKISAGKLEVLATCSYKYFLENILKIKPVDEVVFDPYSWLDPATRGTLLHSIFEQFYKKLKQRDEMPSYEEHEELILQIAHQLIEEQRDRLPSPSDRIFNREVEDILKACRIFLKEEEEYIATYQPRYFEYSFGINDIEPAIIRLPSDQTIKLSGKVDRVDQSVDGHYHIIDYKTGSTYSYSDRMSFNGGRQLQHFIYALAIEQHLKLEQGAVLESSYYFPTSKGKGRRYVRKRDDILRQSGFDILEKLIDVIKHGHFTMTDDLSDCKFCELKTICRRSFYAKETFEAKQMDSNAEGVMKFKGVRIYD